jgi:outer membrane protein OmpA-like peptidoglycan-associated protein
VKRAIIGILILAAAIGTGVAYKFMSGNGSPPSGKGGGGGSLVFAEVEPLTVTGVGGYQLSAVDLGEGNVPLLRIPLDTWGGYAALFAANGGAKPNRESLFYRKGKFAVELVHEESATEQLQGYASGRYPVIWAPMDSLPVLYDALKTDKRIVPKVLGLFDWSSGGDGIIVKNSIKRPSDLKGKIILTSSNVPYSFFLLWYLSQNGMTGQDVKVVWIDDGEKALELFKNERDIVAWVSWTPFITEVVDSASNNYIPDTRVLISSTDANQLIADTYIVRNDLFQDKSEMLAAFVEAMIEGSQEIGPSTYADMAAFYALSGAGEAKAMLDDVHIANFPEMNMFFDDANPIGAHKIFLLAQEYYKQLGALAPSVSYDPERVINTKLLEEIGKKGLYASQKNIIADSFNKKASFDISDLESQRIVLTNDVQLFFEAQKLDFDLKSTSPAIRENLALLDKVFEQTQFLATTVVKLVGHLDTARVEEFKAKGNQAFIEASAQAKLISKKRAEFIKTVLVDKYGIEKDRIITEGRGWDNPVDAEDPAKNRRVEVQFISLE